MSEHRSEQRDDTDAKQQAATQYAFIADLVQRLGCNDDDDDESARTEIIEHPLSVQVRDGWRDPDSAGEPEEYQILLCTGGPAVRIVGSLDRYCEPETAELEYQDWWRPWTRWRPTDPRDSRHLLEDFEPTLLAYARCFYFGEG